MNSKLKEVHPILLVLILFVIGAIAFMFINGIVASLITIFEPEIEFEKLHLYADTFPISYMLYFFLPFQLGFLFVPGAYYFYFLRDRSQKLKYNLKNISWASLLFIAVFLLLPFLNELNYNVAKLIGVFEHLEALNKLNELKITQLIGPTSSYEAYLLGILIIAIITAISEELLFRGFLMNLILKHTRRVDLSIIISALLFAFLHFNYLQLIPLIVFGLALGSMYHVTGTLLPSIIFHAANNGINLYWIRTETEVSWMSEIRWETTIPSIVLLMGLFYLKRKKLY